MSLASWYDAHVVPRFIRCVCGAPAIMSVREKVVPLAHGAVFEIGCGGGINQQYFDPAKITSYCGMDPSAKGRDYARSEADRLNRKVELREGTGEALPFDAGAFDSVVCTFTLCSVHDQRQVLRELHRVLKPGGTLYFAEHGRAPDLTVRKWQERIEPVWKRIAGGCHLTRPIMNAISDASFALHDTGQRYLPGTPRFAGWVEWGAGRPAG